MGKWTTAGWRSRPNRSDPVGPAQDRHRMHDLPLHAVRDLDVAGAATGQDGLRLRAVQLLEEGRSDLLRVLVVLGFHAVRARDAAAGVLDGSDLHAGDELQELYRLLRDALGHR